MALLFTIFQFFVNIVMLNLLIAIMGDQYDIVQESGHEQYLYSKAGIILEYEVSCGRRGLSSGTGAHMWWGFYHPPPPSTSSGAHVEEAAGGPGTVPPLAADVACQDRHCR